MIRLTSLSDAAIRPSVDTSQFDLDELKHALNTLGVNQRGWRLLLDYWGALISPLRDTLIDHKRPLSSLENLALYLGLLQRCEMDLIPPSDLVRVWIRACNSPRCPHLYKVPTGLFRASWKECVKLQNSPTAVYTFLNSDLPAVVNWFFVTDQDQRMDEGQLKRGWDYLYKEYLGWCERCTHTSKKDSKWKPLLQKAFVIEGVLVVELLNPHQVVEEGRIMRHCVANTLWGCRTNEYRVISLRVPETEERIATLGLALSDGVWCIDDMRAQDNEEPPCQLDDVAKEVERLCRESALAEWQADVGTISQRLHCLFISAIDNGKVGFRDSAVQVISALQSGESLPRKVRLEELQAAYIEVIRGRSCDTERKIQVAAMTHSWESILRSKEGRCLLFEGLSDVLDLQVPESQIGLFD